MNFRKSAHTFVILGFILLTGGVWTARFMTSNAASTLKPTLAAQNGNVVNPTSGSADASLAIDGGEGGDETTFSAVYHNEGGTNSDVLFYGFGSATGAFRLHVIHAFIQNKGDDGFSIEYSTSGNALCSDEGSRTWTRLSNIFSEEGRVQSTAAFADVNAEEVCIRINQMVVGDADIPGLQFRDSNGLKIYDIWLEAAEAQVEMSASAGEGPFALGDPITYHIEATNVGAGDASVGIVKFKLPKSVSLQNSSVNQGWYDPITGVWDVGTIKADSSATLEILVILVDAPIRTSVQSTASINYRDEARDLSLSHATSVRFDISESPGSPSVSIPPVIDGIIDSLTPEETETETSTEGELESAERELEEEIGQCVIDCLSTGSYLYIINPDGTTRDTLSDFAQITRLGDRHFQISFEDKGADFDFNDIVFELNIQDCEDIQVTMTELNAGWHHEVRANIFAHDALAENVLIWADSHDGVGETKTFSLSNILDPAFLVCN